MKRRATVALAAAGLMAAWSGCAEEPIPAGRPPEWGVAAGYGLPLDVGLGDSAEHQVVLFPSVGFRLSGRLEFVAAATLERYLTPEGYFVGLLPGGLRLSIGNGALLPYAAINLGFGWTDLDKLPEISRRFNFRLEAAAGLRGRVTERSAWTFEARFAHISNAGTSFPNYGLNSLVLLGGWRFR